MPESIQIVSLSSVPAGVRSWRSQRRGLASVVACKATYRLVAPVVELALEQDPLNSADVFFDGEARRSSLRSASDWAPFKRRTDIVLVGSAHAPAQTQVRRMVSCLGFSNLEKVVEVRCDRWVGDDGAVHEGAPFTKVPLRWERAGGGPETSNPVGIRPVRDGFGKLPLPNLQPIAFDPAEPDWYVPPVGFAPIAPMWPSRASALGAYASTWSERWIESGLPDDLDFAFFQIAPRDQQLESCEPNATLTLENLHPAIDRFSTRLAGHRARALVEPEGLEIEMICDTVVIDTDRLVVTLTWRGSFWESDCPDARRLIVALEPHDSPLPIEALLELAQPAEDTVSLSLRAQAPGAIIALPFEATHGAPSVEPSRPPPSFGPPPTTAKGLLHNEVGFGPPPRVGPTLVQHDDDDDDEKSLPSFETSELLAVVDDPPTDASSISLGPPSPAAVPKASSMRFSSDERPRPPPPPPGSRAGSIPAPPPPPPVSAPPPPPPAPPPPAVPSNPPSARLSKPPVLVPPAQARKGAASSRRGAASAPGVPPITGPHPQAGPGPQAPPPPPPPPAPVAQQRLGVSAIVGSASSPPPPVKSAPQRPNAEPLARTPAATTPAAASPPAVPAHAPAPAPAAAAIAASAPGPHAAAPATVSSAPKKLADKPKKKPVLDLLWYGHGTLAKVRANQTIRATIEDPSDDPQTRNEPDRIVGRVLARVAPLDQAGVRSAFLAAIDDDGVLVRPLVVIEGELTIAYEPLEIVRSFLALHPAPAKPSTEITARLRAAEELVREERPITSALVEEALANLRKLDGSSKTEATVLQSLLEERKWYRRGIVGGMHLVGHTTTAGGQRMLTYLPEDAAVRLPLLPAYRVRLLVEPHLPQEQGSEDDLALVVLALARAAEV